MKVREFGLESRGNPASISSCIDAHLSKACLCMWSSLPHDGGHDSDGGAVTRRDRAGRRQRRRQSSSDVQEGKSA